MAKCLMNTFFVINAQKQEVIYIGSVDSEQP